MMGLVALLFTLLTVPMDSFAGDPSDGVLNDGDKPRVFVSSDIGGSDEDDDQSMVHFFLYADVFNIEGIISSPPKGGRRSDIIEVIEKYESDYDKLKTYADYPTGDELRSITKQGATDAQSGSEPSEVSAGAKHMIKKANESSEPLYVLVWGTLTDVAQAVHKDPSIKDTLRVYSISGNWNTKHDRKAFDYLYNNHQDMWWIDSSSTHRGMYKRGDQSGDLGNCEFPKQHVDGHGALGNYFMQQKDGCIKMGDSPSVLYMLTGTPGDPGDESWGGSFTQPSPSSRPDYWTDKSSGARKTVRKWRENYLRNWQDRMDRAD